MTDPLYIWRCPICGVINEEADLSEWWCDGISQGDPFIVGVDKLLSTFNQERD